MLGGVTVPNISEELKLEIKYRNDIESLISQYVNLRRRGKNLVGLCPFHNEKTPSFTVYPENGSFHCFGCGVGGDVITFAMMIERLDYVEAVKMLADRSLSLKRISDIMNFNNEYYFNAFFKKWAGMPPGEYRKMCREKQDK